MKKFLAIKNIHRKQVEAFVKDYPSLLDNIIIAEGLEPDETIPEIIKSTFISRSTNINLSSFLTLPHKVYNFFQTKITYSDLDFELYLRKLLFKEWKHRTGTMT